MIGKIYIVTNNVNDKVYVGQTWRDLEWYFRCQLLNTKRPDRPKLCNAINKHGKDNFDIELIDTAKTQPKLDQLEIGYIKDYDAIKNGYNCREGGEGGLLSEETKSKISLAKMGTPNLNKRNFSMREVLRIISEYESGKSAREIGLLFDCSKRPILRVLHEQSVAVNKNESGKLDQKTAERIREQHSQGRRQRQLAKQHSLSESMVSMIVNNKRWVKSQ